MKNRDALLQRRSAGGVAAVAEAARGLLVFGLAAGLCLALGCRRGPVLAGAPVAGEGVRVEVLSWDYDDEDLELKLRFYNDLEHEVVVDAHQVAVVGPDGVALYEDDDHDTSTIRPGSAVTVKVSVESDTYDFEDISGIYVRFDGVYSGGVQMRIPPLRLGEPSHEPGALAQLPVPPEARPGYDRTRDEGKKKGLFGRIRQRIRKIAYGNEETRTAAAQEAKGLEQYKGPRRTLSQAGVKVAVMPLKFSEVPEQAAFVADELLLTEMQEVGFEAIGPDDVAAMLNLEVMKDEMGCDEASCAAEIGNALGVPYLTAGSVALVEGSTVITLKLINVQDTLVVARVSRIAEGGTRVFPRVIAEAVQEMVDRAKL